MSDLRNQDELHLHEQSSNTPSDSQKSEIANEETTKTLPSYKPNDEKSIVTSINNTVVTGVEKNEDQDGNNSVAVDMSDGEGSIDDEEMILAKARFFDLFRFATKWDIFWNLCGVVAAGAAGAAQPIMTIIFGNLTTTFLTYTNTLSDPNATPESLAAARATLQHYISQDALYLVYTGIAMFGATYIYMATWIYTGEEITRRTRETYLASILRQEIAYFDTIGAGEVTSRIQNDIHLIQEGISDKFPMSVMFVATFIAGFVVAYARSWQLSLAMSSVLPCIIGAGALMNVFVTKYQQIELQYIAQAASVAEEALSTVRTAKAFAIEQRLVDLYDESNVETTKQGKRKAIVQGVGFGIFFFVIYASYGLAFYFGSKLLASGHLDSGTVMNVIFSIFIGAFSLAMLAPNLTALSYATSAAAKIYETIDRQSQIDSSSSAGLKPESCIGEIELQNVFFRYPARREVPVMEDFSLQIPAGKSTALVGASGSGKSTIVALLERFYDPDEGRVLLDGVDTKELNLIWLRTQMGYVAQEPVLFSTTIRKNIEYGLINTAYEHLSPEEKDKMVKNAAEQSNAHGFITQLPNGYDTLVGERGFLLSGGQKQRVAIARAIVKKPKILLLDEATSALDTQSEGIVQEALDRAAKGRTTIVIAHRLSTIRKSDNIVVMGKGVILDEGTHDSLLAKLEGPYFGLVNAQKIRAGDSTNNTYDREEDIRKAKEKEEREAEKLRLEAKAEMPEGLMRRITSRSVLSGMKEQKPKKKKERRRSLFYLLYRLALINKDYIWTLYVPGIIGSIASGAVYPCFSILFGKSLQDYSLCSAHEGGFNGSRMQCPEPNRSIMRHNSDQNALWFFVISILAVIAIAIQNGFMILASSILMERLRRMTLKAMLRADVSFFDEEENSSGTLTSALAENSQRINGLVGVTLGTIIQSVSTLIIGWVIALAYGWKLALPMIATSPLTLSAGFIRLQIVVLKDKKVKRAHENAAQRACEAAAAIRTVASLTREKHTVDLYKEELKEPGRITHRTAFYGNILYSISQALALPTIALGFWYGSRLLINGEISSGHFFTVLTATVFASIQAGNAFSFVPDVSQAHGAAEESFRLIDSVPEIDSESEKGIILEECEGNVTFEDVHFRYPTRPAVPVLRGIDLEVKAGTYCALVGGSGCGKSTTIQLIERFYDPQAGRVLIDGHDIRTINVRSLRRYMALVSQEPTLYEGTIGWNIALGAAGWGIGDVEDNTYEGDAIEKVTEQQMRKAARQANILRFIDSLPDGFDTLVGSRGTALSGGQKQRIAIARALIREPKILLLDEATSALDSESEQVVQEALDKASRGRTTIAIAHRLSTISRADRIFCLKDGKVNEQGDHSTLMEQNGVYAHLVSLQELQAD
ncbi:hypothetical protein L7F22_053984 [Adiantum nelumboides]|nr:hypothetical protein [Adiantum nelumboides]